MTALQKPTLFAASLALALATSLALAQTSPGKPPAKAAAKPAASKTLGGNVAGGGKPMTRAELRACLARVDELNLRVKELESQRAPLDRERDELKASAEALKAERAEIDRQLASIREWEGRVKAHAADIEAYNKRNAAAPDAPRNQQEQLAEDLKTERGRLQQVREALAVEEARLVPAYRANTAAHNERVTSRDAKVADWNARNAAAVDTAAKQQDARTLWLGECANRPYLEDDEIAIKAGK